MLDLISLLRDLVRLPSVNPMGRTLPESITGEHRVGAYLESFFRHLGVPCERQTAAPGRDNLVAVYQASPDRPTLVFEAHQDTVPVDGMTVEPFGGHIEEGRMYGRGACDIKGGLSAMLSAFARVVRERPASAFNLVMACTVDEEHTFLGVQRLVRGLRADMAVVAEPTNLKIVKAHKGVVRWVIHTRGRACHSSSPERGENAIYHMGRLLPAIEEFARQLAARPPDPVLGPATLSVGRIDGGTSVNTVPDFCRIEVDRRLIPGETATAAPGELHAWLSERFPSGVPFETSAPTLICPALSPQGSENLIARLGAAIDAVAGPHEVTVVPYGTDASTLSAAGIPSVVFGPGDIARAHTRDEWVPLDEVEKASEILYRLACDR